MSEAIDEAEAIVAASFAGAVEHDQLVLDVLRALDALADLARDHDDARPLFDGDDLVGHTADVMVEALDMIISMWRA